MTRSPSDIKQRIFVSTRLRLVITKPLFPDHPTQTLCTAQNLVAHKRRLDSIIGTVPYMHLNPLSATLVLVGYPGNLEQPVLNTAPMVLGRSRWLAERRHYRDPGAARFFGQHGITSNVEVIKMQKINAAYEHMLKSYVKYRFVIDMASLKA